MVFFFLANEVEFINEIPIADPIYDISPSRSEKPASIGSTIDAVLLQEGNARLKGFI